MSKPIRPEEVGGHKATVIPAAVFDAFNAEIAARYEGGRAEVTQKAVMDRLTRAGLERREVFDRGWLNVEAAYEDFGWKVRYEKPGFNEGGEAFFTFEAV